MATTSWIVAGSGTSIVRATSVDWQLPSSVTSSGTPYASGFYNSGTNLESYWLKANSFNLSSIPNDATINGIEFKLNVFAQKTGAGKDVYTVSIVSVNASGVSGGTDFGETEFEAWSSIGFEERTYGGASELWGRAWTPGDIKDQDFGCQLYTGLNSSLWGGGSNTVKLIDYIAVRVHYTVPNATATGTTATATSLALTGLIYTSQISNVDGGVATATGSLFNGLVYTQGIANVFGGVSFATGSTFSPSFGSGTIVATGFTSFATALVFSPNLSTGSSVNVNSSQATSFTFSPSLFTGSSVGVSSSQATALTFLPIVGISKSFEVAFSSASAYTFLGTAYTTQYSEVNGGTALATAFTFNPLVVGVANTTVSGLTSYATALTFLPLVSYGTAIGVTSAQATGFTFTPSVIIRDTVDVSSSNATALTFSPTVFIVNPTTSVLVACSSATARTFTPVFADEVEETLPDIILLEGHPKPQGIVSSSNNKIAVINGKIAYRVTDKFWIKS